MQLNDGYRYRSQVDSWADGMRLTEYLAARFAHSDKTTWLARVHEGEIELNDCVTTIDCELKSGAFVVWNRPPWAEIQTPQEFGILHEDAELLAVFKPSGLPTLPGGGFLKNTLLTLVRGRYRDATPLHRLGRGTSGIVLFARTKHAAKVIGGSWPQVTKIYRALAQGTAEADRYLITTPIGLREHPNVGKVHAAASSDTADLQNASVKPATSIARVLERRNTSAGSETLFEVDLKTGRPHQIRIHLASIGHPLVGDPIYVAGGGLGPMPGLPSDLGYQLHASTLSLIHPSEKRPLTIRCSPPQSLRTKSEVG